MRDKYPSSMTGGIRTFMSVHVGGACVFPMPSGFLRSLSVSGACVESDLHTL